MTTSPGVTMLMRAVEVRFGLVMVMGVSPSASTFAVESASLPSSYCDDSGAIRDGVGRGGRIEMGIAVRVVVVVEVDLGCEERSHTDHAVTRAQ